MPCTIYPSSNSEQKSEPGKPVSRNFSIKNEKKKKL